MPSFAVSVQILWLTPCMRWCMRWSWACAVSTVHDCVTAAWSTPSGFALFYRLLLAAGPVLSGPCAWFCSAVLFPLWLCFLQVWGLGAMRLARMFGLPALHLAELGGSWFHPTPRHGLHPFASGGVICFFGYSVTSSFWVTLIDPPAVCLKVSQYIWNI